MKNSDHNKAKMKQTQRNIDCGKKKRKTEKVNKGQKKKKPIINILKEIRKDFATPKQEQGP